MITRGLLVQAALPGALAGAVALALAGSACNASGPPKAPPASSLRPTVASNVSRADYASDAACIGCHAEISLAFAHSPMHEMTRRADGGVVKAPFAGARFALGGDSATVEQHGGRRYMRITPEDGTETLWRITKVIGGRTREDFVGGEVDSTEPDAAIRGDERIMPLSYLLFTASWRYKGYSVMVKERDHLRPGVSWRQTCIFCHNTVPLLDTLYDDLLPTKHVYQGSVSDNLLPIERTWKVVPRDESALIEAVRDELAPLDVAPPRGTLDSVLVGAIGATRKRFGESDLVELGVGCESCHLGARAHAEHPEILPSFDPKGSGIAVVPPDGGQPTRAASINHACARCHTVLFSGYPFTWEGAARADAPGGSHINSGEARDFLLGGCASAMACTTCHDVHRGSSREKLDELGTTKGNATCTGCHPSMATERGLRAHTHHAPGSEGSACLSCHMPRKNVGLRYELTRYHRIGSPTDEARVYGDRPLECALCHADWSVE